MASQKNVSGIEDKTSNKTNNIKCRGQLPYRTRHILVDSQEAQQFQVQSWQTKQLQLGKKRFSIIHPVKANKDHCMKCRFCSMYYVC